MDRRPGEVRLNIYQNIPIVTIADALRRIEAQK
jgi:hypothetical protein